jgi:hypothetical protein
MSKDTKAFRLQAVEIFEEARRKANREQLAGRLLGRETRPLPFEVIRRNLRQQSPLYRGIQYIPLDLIVGSVGRYNELTRRFLPLTDSMKERWVNVTVLAMTEGWQPVDLYKIGEAYFVKDGNHRISAARKLGYPSIEAQVWEFPEEIWISPTDKLDDILCRFSERDFMQMTGFDQRHPGHPIRFTTAGRYSELKAQIEEVRQKLASIDEREIPYEEAVDLWYELIYLPAVQIIRESSLLSAFPGRTEADLFVWLSIHRDRLGEAYGEYENLAVLAQTLVDAYGEKPIARARRKAKRLLGRDELPPLADPDPTVKNK